MLILYIHLNRVYCAIMLNDHLAPFGNREKSTRTSHFYHQNSSSFEKWMYLYMVKKALGMNRKHTSERVKDNNV